MPPAIGPALTDEPVVAGVDEIVVIGVMVDTVDGVVKLGLRLTVEKLAVVENSIWQAVIASPSSEAKVALMVA